MSLSAWSVGNVSPVEKNTIKDVAFTDSRFFTPLWLGGKLFNCGTFFSSELFSLISALRAISVGPQLAIISRKDAGLMDVAKSVSAHLECCA